MNCISHRLPLLLICACCVITRLLPAAEPGDGQPLAANVERVVQALEFLGAPWRGDILTPLRAAVERHDADKIAEILDPECLLEVTINPEGRVKVQKGRGRAVLQQAGYTPCIVKVENQGALGGELRITSPQAGQVYAGMTPLSAQRMQRTGLRETAEKEARTGRFLALEMYVRPPMTADLAPSQVQYAIALIYSSEPGAREATISVEAGQGQDLGFRGEVPILFHVRPAIPVQLRIRDENGASTTAALTFRDAADHVFPPQSKRLAPDFYFQPQIYRKDGETVLLPAGKFTLEATRGPEYRVVTRQIEVPATAKAELPIKLERWVNAADYGFYSGDHHIHGAGCAHYTSPTEGVRPEDMFAQVKGEGLNVGCILTWGPCFEFQRRFFTPQISPLSEAFTLLKYDLEISGFGSEALGHVCLLNLKDQTYPGSEGTKTKGWPSWTTPVMQWTKKQGGFAGYAHSASGLEINAQAATARLFKALDSNGDRLLTMAESEKALLPLPFGKIDQDGDRALTESELIAAHDAAAEMLPNLAIPQMNGVGAMEIPVSLVAGVCDFISAMDTPRIAEWNMWYHLLNCGFQLKASGETDFPCMSGERVGQGRVYVQLGKVRRVDFGEWCRALAQGRSYVSDGFAHALELSVNGERPGEGDVKLSVPGGVKVRAKVAFAPELPETAAQGLATPPDGKRWLGDTVTLHGPRTRQRARGGSRSVEIVVNGKPAASHEVPADGAVHDLEFEVPVTQSAWVALRQFPELHTNPVNVIVAGKPIRASRQSALWAVECIELLWRNREKNIRPDERPAAREAFDKAVARFRQIAAESGD